MLASPEFNAVWNCIKDWDISVPQAYGGYCGATGNHVRAILDALSQQTKP
jgi:methionine synthase I (cobalamin-dependent)